MTICHLYRRFGAREGNKIREVKIQITEGEQMRQINGIAM